MGEIRDHRDLCAWQAAMDAAVQTYRVSATFPKAETYGLTAQIRRAAVSAPSNIAEGQARGASRAALNHLGIALGSLAEVDCQLEVALRLDYIAAPQAGELKGTLDSARRLVHGLRRAKRLRLTASLAAPAILTLLALRMLS